MNLFELLLIALGLSMDAFAVSICFGLTMPKVTVKKALIVALYFGIFQGIMPLIGYLLASKFSEKIIVYDHWIAFILLSFIGTKMLLDSSSGKRPDDEERSLKPDKMLPFAIATSIDALAVGISFAFLQVSIVPAVLVIGVVTLVFSMIGVKIGNLFGMKFKSKAEFAGGLILILMGFKILLEHLGIIL